MEHQTSITDTKKVLKELMETNQEFLSILERVIIYIYLLSYKSYNMDVSLKYAFMFSDLYFGALWVCILVVSGPSL